jgi:hypothetical protein
LNELTKTFEGQPIKVKTDRGNTLINLANTARICGMITVAKSGNEVIRWSRVKERLEIIKNGIGENMPTQILEEINFILSEIENTDDRNTIYMSTWLTKRLAVECHSPKANAYKNFLVTLDESVRNEETNKSVLMVSQIVNQIIPTITE